MRFTEWTYDTGENIWAVAVSPNGDYVAAVTGGGSYTEGRSGSAFTNKLYLFHKGTSTPRWTYTLPGGTRQNGTSLPYAKGVSVAMNNDTIVVGGQIQTLSADEAGDAQGRVTCFSIDSSTPLWVFNDTKPIAAGGESWNFSYVSISRDSKYVVASGNTRAVLLNENGIEQWEHHDDDDLYEGSMFARISKSGDYVFLGGREEKCYLIKTATGELVWTATITDNIYDLCISNDAEYCYCSTTDTRLWAFKGKDGDGTPLWTSGPRYDSEGQARIGCACSADGTYIFSGGQSEPHFFKVDGTMSGGYMTPQWSAADNSVPNLDTVDLSDDGYFGVVCSRYNDKIITYRCIGGDIGGGGAIAGSIVHTHTAGDQVGQTGEETSFGIAISRGGPLVTNHNTSLGLSPRTVVAGSYDNKVYVHDYAPLFKKSKFANMSLAADALQEATNGLSIGSGPNGRVLQFQQGIQKISNGNWGYWYSLMENPASS